VHHSFSKLRKILILKKRKRKALEIGEIHLKTQLNNPNEK